MDPLDNIHNGATATKTTYAFKFCGWAACILCLVGEVAVTFYSYSFSPYVLFSGKHMEIDPLNVVPFFVLTDSIVLFNVFGIPSAVFMQAPSFFF